MIAARENARELIEEADLLTEHRRHARAYALLHTACEELGKFAIMEIAARQITLGRSPHWRRLWARLRSHNSKSTQLELQLRLLAASARTDQDYSGLAKTLFGRGLIVRNAAFYVDEDPEGRFRAPSEINFEIPLPAIRALAPRALETADQREDRQAIEQALKSPSKLDNRASTTMLFIEMVGEAREAGMSEEQLLDMISRKWRR